MSTPPAGVGGRVQFVFGPGLRHLDHRPRVGPCGSSGALAPNPEPLREFERGLRHVVSLLLRRGVRTSARGRISRRSANPASFCEECIEGRRAATTTSPPLAPVIAELTKASAATFMPTCFMQTSARLPANDMPSASSTAVFSFDDHVRWTPRAAARGCPWMYSGDFGRGCARIGIDTRQSAWSAPQREGFVSE